MSLEDLFPPESLSTTEEHLIAEVFTQPVVRKYLRIMAANDAGELLSLSAISNDANKIAQSHATVQGKLQVLATLLAIEAPQPK